MNYAVPYQPGYPQAPAAPSQAVGVGPGMVGAPLQGLGPGVPPGYSPGFGGPAQGSAPGYTTPVSPVSPVAGPSYAPAQGQSAQQNPQQAYARHLVGVARNLEQAIPGYQFLVSSLQDLLKEAGADRLPAAQKLKESMKEATFHHFATLGAIRRLLCGEVTADLMSALALSVTRLLRIHSEARPLLEQLVNSAPQEVRAALGGLATHLASADTQLGQAAAAVQAAVYPQIWENAQAQVFGTGQATLRTGA